MDTQELNNLEDKAKNLMEEIEKLSEMNSEAKKFSEAELSTDELLQKLIDLNSSLEFYSLSDKERNAAEVLASSGEISLFRNKLGKLECEYNKPNMVKRFLSFSF